MTNPTATSASDRVDAARAALTLHDAGKIKCYSDDPAERYDVQKMLAEAVRAMIEPAETVETPEALADAWRDNLTARGTIEVLGEHAMSTGPHAVARAAYLAGVHKGISVAWESWEPDDYAEANGGSRRVTDADRAELAEAITACRVAAEGDSNDTELEKLNDALSIACGLLGVESVWA